MSLAEEKRRLRRTLVARRRAVPTDRARASAERVARHLERTPEFESAPRVALYAALPDELPTKLLFELCRRAGKRVLLPRVAGDALEFASVAGWSELRPGAYGVSEPAPEVPGEILEKSDLVLVPGVAFDRSGHRLGRGGGHYDRTLSPEPGGPIRFGLAYTFQLVASVPHGPRDRRVDAIVTEEGIQRLDEGARFHADE